MVFLGSKSVGGLSSQIAVHPDIKSRIKIKKINILKSRVEMIVNPTNWELKPESHGISADLLKIEGEGYSFDSFRLGYIRNTYATSMRLYRTRAKYVIHVVVEPSDQMSTHEVIYWSTRNSIAEANKIASQLAKGKQSVAIPLIGSGVFRSKNKQEQDQAVSVFFKALIDSKDRDALEKIEIVADTESDYKLLKKHYQKYLDSK